jgi:hypothetical protein
MAHGERLQVQTRLSLPVGGGNLIHRHPVVNFAFALKLPEE